MYRVTGRNYGRRLNRRRIGKSQSNENAGAFCRGYSVDTIISGLLPFQRRARAFVDDGLTRPSATRRNILTENTLATSRNQRESPCGKLTNGSFISFKRSVSIAVRRRPIFALATTERSGDHLVLLALVHARRKQARRCDRICRCLGKITLAIEEESLHYYAISILRRDCGPVWYARNRPKNIGNIDGVADNCQ